MLKQHPVLEKLADAPDESEILLAVKRSNLSGPGITGAHVAVWKALFQVEETRMLVAQVAEDFWETEETPPE
jgi:hypothetical protein